MATTKAERREWRCQLNLDDETEYFISQLLDDLDSLDESCRCEVAWDMPGAGYCCKCGHPIGKEEHE